MNKKDPSFYGKMQEAKKRKKAALEAAQLQAEFDVHPERFQANVPIIVKTDAEVKMDEAFGLLQAKLRAANPTPADKIQQAFDDLTRKAQGI